MAIGTELALSGCGIVQLRAKNLSKPVIRRAGTTLLTVFRNTATILIINDHVDVAAEIGAHGVHLGQTDENLQKARERLGQNAIIGRSTHNIEQVQRAVGADYIGFGPVFPTQTKAITNDVVGLAMLRRAVGVSTVPVIGIGGITRQRLPAIRATGVHGWAVISEILNSEMRQEIIEQMLV